ncbi:hypothetical protein MRX96_036774 [Rhipicephalus microplus]
MALTSHAGRVVFCCGDGEGPPSARRGDGGEHRTGQESGRPNLLGPRVSAWRGRPTPTVFRLSAPHFGLSVHVFSAHRPGLGQSGALPLVDTPALAGFCRNGVLLRSADRSPSQTTLANGEERERRREGKKRNFVWRFDFVCRVCALREMYSSQGL